MLVADYDAFVQRNDLNKHKAFQTREDIAIYGLVGELGSLISAVKRRLIAEAPGIKWNTSTDEILEEIGDAMWYCFSLSNIINKGTVNILIHDIASLKRDLSGTDENSRRIQGALSKNKVDEFLARAEGFRATPNMTLDEYQGLAILTARTGGKIFLGVCLTVLAQLSAELLRRRFPKVEVAINTTIPGRKINTILGEISWHLSAVASVYKIKLSEVAEFNYAKVEQRLDDKIVTKLHDDGFKEHEKFPRKFEVQFVTIGKGRSRMYLRGKQLGDELTDNAYDEDGYRFHDVLHLANIANLGWSPVQRSMQGLKRKSDKKIDEVEDGARAKIVEEAVVKVIHSEGVRIAEQNKSKRTRLPLRLFPSRNDVTFRFLSLIHTFVQGLEVSANTFREWENTILQGCAVFHELRLEEQGTVEVDLDKRSLTFRPDVYVDLHGTIAGMGSAVVNAVEFSKSERQKRTGTEWAGEEERLKQSDFSDVEIAREIATKRAILSALVLAPNSANFRSLRIKDVGANVSVKAAGKVREVMWARKIVSFRTTVTQSGMMTACTALAISDAHDALS